MKPLRPLLAAALVAGGSCFALASSPVAAQTAHPPPSAPSPSPPPLSASASAVGLLLYARKRA